jgi:hypothetical protein
MPQRPGTVQRTLESAVPQQSDDVLKRYPNAAQMAPRFLLFEKRVGGIQRR